MKNLWSCHKTFSLIWALSCLVPAFAQESSNLYAENHRQKTIFYFPLSSNDFSRISSPYGYRKHPIHKKVMMHRGVDLAAAKGKPVYAAASGVVEIADYEKSYGNRVLIAHLKDLKTLYGHLWIKMVRPGDKVSKGQLIGFVGDTGLATGPHLHYEVWVRGERVDPMIIWKKISENNKIQY